MNIQQTASIDKAHSALANVITHDMGVYLSPSNEVIPFGLLLCDVLIELGYGVNVRGAGTPPIYLYHNPPNR